MRIATKILNVLSFEILLSIYKNQLKLNTFRDKKLTLIFVGSRSCSSTRENRVDIIKTDGIYIQLTSKKTSSK